MRYRGHENSALDPAQSVAGGNSFRKLLDLQANDAAKLGALSLATLQLLCYHRADFMGERQDPLYHFGIVI